MKEEFLLSVFHPDEAINYLFTSYKELKSWRKNDGYRYPIEEGGSCYYTYHTQYTQKRLKEANERCNRNIKEESR